MTDTQSNLSKIHSGRRHTPPRLLVYGVEGIGKSSLGAKSPDAIFIPTEDGLDQIDCDSFPLAKSVGDVEAALTALATEKHDYQTVVIDSLDWLERLIWADLCEKYGAASIDKVDGGYAKGYTHAVVQLQSILDGLAYLRDEREMMVVLLAHAKVEKFEDPESAAYDRYTPRLHRKANALICEWVDAILFATRKIITQTEDAGFNRKRTTAAGLGHDGGERILRCVGTPACVAKNRYSLPAELPLAWTALMDGIVAASAPEAKEESSET